jgi:hypothetical protein
MHGLQLVVSKVDHGDQSGDEKDVRSAKLFGAAAKPTGQSSQGRGLKKSKKGRQLAMSGVVSWTKGKRSA